jgi:tetratricopeptide (TPR) repeat protein
MQQGRYEDAKDMYDLILEVQPTNGDILHARCASLLEQGYFVTAQEMWKEAIKKCPKHNGILLHVKKQDAYRPLALENAPLDQNGNINSFMFDTIIPNKCFMTKPDQPLLTLKECKQIIEWSEAAAAEQGQGWTTSRHYAVPTTDIPVHEIPRVLSLFNSILTNKLRPLLALQFGEDQLGVNGCNLHIHDAFVVRYDGGGGQRYLPLHRDQSTHSFTIALNDTSEYDGGGTFVCHLGRAIKPNIGGVVSFRGDELLHGGDPVLSGRRYIIVGFCYASKISDKLKRKHDELDQWFVRHKKVKGNGSSHQSQGVNSAVSNKNEGFAFDFQI